MLSKGYMMPIAIVRSKSNPTHPSAAAALPGSAHYPFKCRRISEEIVKDILSEESFLHIRRYGKEMNDYI